MHFIWAQALNNDFTILIQGFSMNLNLSSVFGFRFPLQRLLHSEPEEHRLYHWAHRMGRDSDKECEEIFPSCSFSLIDMALGGYSGYEDEEDPANDTWRSAGISSQIARTPKASFLWNQYLKNWTNVRKKIRN